MRKYFFILLISVSFKAQSQTLRDSLLNLNLENYLNKPIDSFLNKIPVSYDSITTAAASSMFVGAKVIVVYSDYIILIYPATTNYYTPLNSQHQPSHIAWPLNLLRLELIESIEISSRITTDPYILKEAFLD